MTADLTCPPPPPRLMQITQDKCEGRDKAGCQEPYFNVKTAAAVRCAFLYHG